MSEEKIKYWKELTSDILDQNKVNLSEEVINRIALDFMESSPDINVNWVVNSISELGVEVNGEYRFLYKGHSIIYKDNINSDDNSKVFVRPVFKREFGECCHPVNYSNPKLIGTVSLADSDEWVELPGSSHKDAV